MLKPLHQIHESLLFGKLWRKQATRLRKPGQSNTISLSDVATKVWHPAYEEQLKEISDKLTDAVVSLGDVDNYFRDLIEKESVLKEELRRVMNLEVAVDDSPGKYRVHFEYCTRNVLDRLTFLRCTNGTESSTF